MLLALLVWLGLAFFLGFLLRHGLARKRPALVAFTIVLALVSLPRPFIFMLGLDPPMPASHFGGVDWQLVSRALLFCLLWAVAVSMSYLINGRMARPLAPLLPRGGGTLPSGARVALVLLAPAVFAVVGTGFLLAQAGGLSAFIMASKLEKALAGYFIFKESARLAAILALFGYLSLRADTAPAAHWGRLACLLTGSIMVICTLLWGARYDFLLMSAVVLLAWRFHVGPIGVVRLALFAGALFCAAYALRIIRAEILVQLATSLPPQPFWRQLSAGMHFVQFDALMLVIRDAGDVFAFRWGADFVNGMQSWIPRSLFPEKETFHIGPWFRRVYQPMARNGWPVTTVGAWYLNFGIIGILLGAYVSGLALRIWDEAFDCMRQSPWQASVGAALSVYMFEAGIGTGFPQDVILLIVPLWLAALFLFGPQMRSQKSRSVPRAAARRAG